MEIKKLMKDISAKKTWSRVAELNKIGYFKDKEKRILFGNPIPWEDILPLRITIALGMVIMVLAIVIASGMFSMMVNIVLCVLIVILILLPVILRAVLKSE